MPAPSCVLSVTRQSILQLVSHNNLVMSFEVCCREEHFSLKFPRWGRCENQQVEPPKHCFWSGEVQRKDFLSMKIKTINGKGCLLKMVTNSHEGRSNTLLSPSRMSFHSHWWMTVVSITISHVAVNIPSPLHRPVWFVVWTTTTPENGLGFLWSLWLTDPTYEANWSAGAWEARGCSLEASPANTDCDVWNFLDLQEHTK